MVRTTVRLLSGLLPVLLGGCIAVGDIDRRADTINAQVANGQNQGVLLNLARATRNEPIYVVAFNQLSASGTMEFRAGAPQFFAGPNLPAADKIATFTGGSTFLDNSTNTNFQMSLLGSKDFYSGLMSPITLQDVDLLLHQGYARELIFYLVIAKATITPMRTDESGKMVPAGPPQVIFNDPSALVDEAQHPDQHPPSKSFANYIREAMEHGLTTETYMAPDDAAGEDDSAAGGSGGGGSAAPKKPKLTPHAELCYDRSLVKEGDVGDIDPNSFCGVKDAIRPKPAPPEPLYVKLNDIKGFEGVPLQVEVSTRSIYGMYYYLGDIIGRGYQDQVRLHHYDLTAETTVDEPLIDVQTSKGVGADGCFTAIGYHGRTYCAPEEGPGADNTKRIIAILNALTALKQSNADIPSTQTVRIQQ